MQVTAVPTTLEVWEGLHGEKGQRRLQCFMQGQCSLTDVTLYQFLCLVSGESCKVHVSEDPGGTNRNPAVR